MAHTFDSWMQLSIAVFMITMGSGSFIASRSPQHVSALPAWLDKWGLPALVWGVGMVNIILLAVK